MWDRIARSLAGFQNAVLTGIDPDGYPISLRCVPQIDPDRQVLHVQIPLGTAVQPGPADLLCHSHNERLWNFRSFVVHGRLEQESQGWVFHPRHFIPGNGFGGLMSQLKMLLKARRAARRYLEKRGLPRPKIPWASIQALQAEARRRVEGVTPN
jgi:hypothetical protein